MLQKPARSIKAAAGSGGAPQASKAMQQRFAVVALYNEENTPHLNFDNGGGAIVFECFAGFYRRIRVLQHVGKRHRELLRKVLLRFPRAELGERGEVYRKISALFCLSVAVSARPLFGAARKRLLKRGQCCAEGVGIESRCHAASPWRL